MSAALHLVRSRAASAGHLYREADMPEFLTDKQLAALLNCSRTTVWARTQDQTLPQPYRFGRCTRWRRQEVEQALAGAR
jgi:excisionase family DNA binding protein